VQVTKEREGQKEQKWLLEEELKETRHDDDDD